MGFVKQGISVGPLSLTRHAFFYFVDRSMLKKCTFSVSFISSFRGISNEEKIHLRQKLLSHLREENDQVDKKRFAFFKFKFLFILLFCRLETVEICCHDLPCV